MYCGDETGSFIGDVGSHVCRFGYGGEDNPKLVTGSSFVNTSRRRMVGSTLHYYYHHHHDHQPSTSSSTMESILRMPTLNLSDEKQNDSDSDDDDDDGSGIEPLTDPNSFLRQGDSIENWDALEILWETSMDTLRARDTKKHTVGGMPYTRPSSDGTVVAAAEGGRCTHPILAVMPGMTEFVGYGREYAKAHRRTQYEKYTELLMESSGPISASSCFLAPAPMLAAFSLGRQTALIVDMGAGGSRVTPICDGLVLEHSQRRNGRGGDWLDNVMWKAMIEENIEPKPRYVLQQQKTGGSIAEDQSTTKAGIKSSRSKAKAATKSANDSVTTATSAPPPPIPPIFHARAMRNLMYEVRTEPFVKLQASSEDARVPFESLHDDDDDPMEISSPGSTSGSVTTYQLPDGTPIDLSTPFGRDLKQVPELFFADKSRLPFRTGVASSSSTNPAGLLTLSDAPLHKLVHESLLSVGDVDLRKELAQAVCLVGGASQCPNVESRLSHELSQLLPSFVKPKVVASRFAVERSCASWIGGSILTSLGSFQQLWLSKAEYEEYGVNSIQRFP